MPAATDQAPITYAVSKVTEPTSAIGENRSEEHTSELQSQSKLVCRLLLENKNAAARAGANAAHVVVVHPLLGSHVRLMEEPERHAWQAEVGVAALPWLGDHRIHNVAALPGAAYCEMALAAAHTVLCFFTDAPTTGIYTLSLHDALPI